MLGQRSRAEGGFPALYKTPCNPSTQEMETGGEGRGHPELHSEFKASLGSSKKKMFILAGDQGVETEDGAGQRQQGQQTEKGLFDALRT